MFKTNCIGIDIQSRDIQPFVSWGSNIDSDKCVTAIIAIYLAIKLVNMWCLLRFYNLRTGGCFHG